MYRRAHVCGVICVSVHCSPRCEGTLKHPLHGLYGVHEYVIKALDAIVWRAYSMLKFPRLSIFFTLLEASRLQRLLEKRAMFHPPGKDRVYAAFVSILWEALAAQWPARVVSWHHRTVRAMKSQLLTGCIQAKCNNSQRMPEWSAACEWHAISQTTAPDWVVPCKLSGFEQYRGSPRKTEPSETTVRQ